MPTNISGRITLTLLVLWASLSLIFPSVPPSLFWFLHPTQPISFKPALKPGIDMVGGTSLIYEIKAPADSMNSNLAEEVMQSLKKRVDPDGVRNLIWRPQGSTRLEIQMPMSPQGKQAKALREEYSKAQQALEETNLSPGEVRHAVENLEGEARSNRIREMAGGSTRRGQILGALRQLADQIRTARQEQNAAAQATHQLEFDQLFDQLFDTNLPVADLERVLDQPNAEDRQKALAEIKQRYADFPARQAAIDEFARVYEQFSKVRSEIDDASELKRLLRGSGVIEFHILANDLPAQEYQAAVEGLQRRGPRYQAGDVRWYEVERGEEVMQRVARTIDELGRTTDPRQQEALIRAGSENNTRAMELYRAMIPLLNDPVARRGLQKEIEDMLALGHPLQDYAGKKWVLGYVTPDRSMAQREGRPRWALERAYPLLESGQRQVGFTFDTQGAIQFSQLTGNNIGRPLAIVLDDQIISAPNINSQISRSGVITGGGAAGFSMGELTYLVNTLNAGALPAQLTEEPISEQTVGSNIGEDNLRRGLNACYFGLVVVAFFLIGYYYLAGVVAMIAVLMNMALILGAMAGLNASFTLPGIAGIVLTIGMAVDANVLIFERLREEQVRGLSLRMALRNAYDRAFSAIFDGNLTTGITAAALYFFGSDEIRGFGLTLLLGIVSSMFTSLFVTKTLFAILVDRMGVQQLSSLPLTFPKWDRMLRPDIDWMSKAWAFYAFSGVFIVIGLAMFGIKWGQGQMLDIEFASGTAIQVQLKEPAPIGEIREIITEASKQRPEELPAANVVTVGDDGKTFEIISPNESAQQVKSAVLAVLGDRLSVALESKFDGSQQNATEALGENVLIPIEPSTQVIDSKTPRDLQKHIGGVAIVLKNLDPPLPAEELQKRVEQMRLQASRRFFRVNVEGSDDGRSAIVLASEADLSYDPADPIKQQQWMDELAGPTWNLVREAVTQPADLQKVTSFNAQIADEAQHQALIAMFVSTLAIMVYIWMRFGNLKYGTATVLALVHDTLFTLAAVGMAHFVAGTPIGNALLLEPFRVNLNLVAAVLTVMGYSMNDSVVVFDRIRENRGKFGHVDRKIINDSINQTLSRTLLTGGTTILTIFVMYVFGGPGIHGFTFALLVGIVVGTYSSIAIASPLLLLGGEGALDGDRRTATPGRRQFQGA